MAGSDSEFRYTPPEHPLSSGPFSDEELGELRTFIEKHGPQVVARRLRMRSDLLAAIVTGLRVKESSRLAYRYRLREARQRGEEL